MLLFMKYFLMKREAFFENLFWYKKLQFPIGKKAYLIGTPTHTNLGDSAIVMAEKLFLQRVYGKSVAIKELTVSEYKECQKYLRFSSTGSRFFGMGGGTWAICGMQRKHFAKCL